ncbi:hypothetical protein ACQR50_02055 [Sphingomonas sp. Xoc002]|uniref:hypothetical protein n=1 Tax=Sphingomonas sp. Xoc002 TaxID=2837624 RepID=UPI003D17D0AC
MLGSFNHLSMSKKLTLCLGAIIAIMVGVDGTILSNAGQVKATTEINEHTYLVADQQTRAHGFALDLSNGGPDGEDAAFGRAA